MPQFDESPALPAVSIIGSPECGGTYLLRIRVMADLELQFGRFQQGRLLSIPRGEYVYVGSALASRGSASPGRRLLRHASRSAGRRPHELCLVLSGCLQAAGLTPPKAGSPGEKRLFWHVDYLLDREEADLSHVILLGGPGRREAAVAGFLREDPRVRVVAGGLGAADSPGSTHLLRVEGDEGWWVALLAKLEGGFCEQS